MLLWMLKKHISVIWPYLEFYLSVWADPSVESKIIQRDTTLVLNNFRDSVVNITVISLQVQLSVMDRIQVINNSYFI
jgi:hypothetical protein